MLPNKTRVQVVSINPYKSLTLLVWTSSDNQQPDETDLLLPAISLYKH